MQTSTNSSSRLKISPFLHELAYELKSLKPSRKIVLRTFHEARKSWIIFGLGNGISLYLLVLYIRWLYTPWDVWNSPVIYAPFIGIAYFSIYAYAIYQFRKEYKLFKGGVAVKGSITHITIGFNGINSNTTSTATFKFKGNEFSRVCNYRGVIDEPVVALINPFEPSYNKIYFRRSSSLFKSQKNRRVKYEEIFQKTENKYENKTEKNIHWDWCHIILRIFAGLFSLFFSSH